MGNARHATRDKTSTASKSDGITRCGAADALRLGVALVLKFGVSWQVSPRDIAGLWGNGAQAKRVFEAISKMSKIDLAALERAARGA